MSQSVKIAGALFQNVPSISVPDENNVYHGFFDVSDTTATASDVASGKFFHDALGVLTAGTASGGGGGLTYETGTYTPSADIARPQITWTNTHTEAPILVAMIDTSSASTSSANSNVLFVYWDPYKIFGTGFPYSTSATRYADALCLYRNSSNITTNNVTCQYNSDNTSSSNSNYPRYWASPTDFHPGSNSTSRYWRQGRTYKWIAVWKPTS